MARKIFDRALGSRFWDGWGVLSLTRSMVRKKASNTRRSHDVEDSILLNDTFNPLETPFPTDIHPIPDRVKHILRDSSCPTLEKPACLWIANK